MGPLARVRQFNGECRLRHPPTDAPIVHHCHPGRSHLHDFFGNTATDARSTPESLVGGDTTCQNKLDTAAYWAPALLRDGEALRPTGSGAYYRPGVGVDPTSVESFPEGLVVVAGDPPTTEPPPLAIAAWHRGAPPATDR